MVVYFSRHLLVIMEIKMMQNSQQAVNIYLSYL